jgi:hypothetical protein
MNRVVGLLFMFIVVVLALPMAFAMLLLRIIGKPELSGWQSFREFFTDTKEAIIEPFIEGVIKGKDFYDYNYYKD